MLRVNFVNFILDNSNFYRISESKIKKKPYLEQSETLFERKKKTINQILLSKLWYIVDLLQNYIKKEIEGIYNFLLNGKNATSQAASSTIYLK